MLLPLKWPEYPLSRAPAPTYPPILLLVDRRDPLLKESLEVFPEFLTPRERERMHRYRRPEDRQRFLIGRGLLRLLLGRILDRSPGQVRLGRGPHGKPFVIEDPPQGGTKPGAPRFNLSHSGDLVLIALHPTREVGVDLEQVREGIDWLPIARRYLAEEQRLQIEQSPEQDRPAAFFRQWCRLEARLKLSGVGLAGIDPVGLGAVGAGAAILRDVELPAGYRGALAMEDPRAAGRRR